jgi:hypothetical protein
MSFLTGCFVVCKAHGPGELPESYDACPRWQPECGTKFWSYPRLRDLLCVMTVSAATHHAKKNQQAQQET